jgi:TolB-like protein/Flp pilus assembly protein TadD
MASIIDGYEYDIFISYRQKDNKGDRWVSEFVDALKTELESTFKEDVSVYYDINPDDGLLETHDVDASLKDKLKCLVFIPIISRTYVDPKSFAWQHEFVAFNKLAKNDRFGRELKLSHGNVTSRILPIKIHDLDSEDKTLLEGELGGVLRPIEFIYKSSGVNRPLKPDDSRSDNLNHTYYRDQINKVAIATKEIISSLRSPMPEQNQSGPIAWNSLPERSKTRKNLTRVSVLILLLLAAFYCLFYLFFKPRVNTALSDKSIAVLPFVDMSPGHDQEYLGDGLAEAVINSLASVKGLRVIGRTSSFQFKEEKIDITKIGQKLNVSTILEGSVQKIENRIRITVQLISTADNSHIWSHQYDEELNDIFKIQDNISASIIENLRLKWLDSGEEQQITQNAEAYELYLKGRYEYRTISPQGFDNAVEIYKKAIELDPVFASAYSGLAWSYIALGSMYSLKLTALEAYDLAKPFLDKSLELNPDLGEAHILLGYYNLYRNWDFKESEKEFKKALQLDPSNPDGYSMYINFLNFTGRHNEALTLANRQLEVEPYYPNARKAYCLFYLGRHQEAIQFQKTRLISFRSPFNFDIYGFLNLNSGNYPEAIQSFQQAIELLKIRVPRMLGWMGAAYAKAGQKENASELLDELKVLEKKSNAGAPNFFMAVVYTALDDKESALSALQEAYDEHDSEMPWLLAEPQLYPLHDDSRFKDLVKKMGFPNTNSE